tara:strand:- start:507 stop:701 length:195 start_codon:yes stop_codon:yes gene_type:complete
MAKLRSLQGHQRFQSKLRKAMDEQKYGKKKHGGKPAAPPAMKSPRSAKINAMKAKLKKEQAKKK